MTYAEPDDIQTAVHELERAGHTIIQIIPVGARWGIVHSVPVNVIQTRPARSAAKGEAR